MKFGMTTAFFAGLTMAMMGVAVAQTPIDTPDMPASFTAPQTGYDYTKRVVMMPMRDGVKLYTVIVIPKGASHAPILLTRTPYDAKARVSRNDPSPHMLDELPQGDGPFVEAGYIRVFQDVRGLHNSEGKYYMTPAPIGPLNKSGIDDTTDAYDTIDWLVKNVPESNGKVGMLGSSYEGFTVVMALIHPHPALKVACPESPMVDGWMGDDWFHYGAFRQPSLDYFTAQLVHGGGKAIPRVGYDDYSNFLNIGSAGDFARYGGAEQLPFWKKVEEHPAYDAFWQGLALDKIMGAVPLKVPVMWLQGLWDQEDMWGAIHSYQAVEPKDKDNDKNFLVMGPWRHSQVNYDAFNLGPLKWSGDTDEQFRREVLVPFFNQYLKDGAPKADTPPVFIYNTGENHWDRFKKWPLSCETGCANASKPMYLEAGGALSFEAPKAADVKFDEYVSDPAKPVPYRPRPVVGSDHDAWTTWLVTDQRFVDGRPDVLTYETEPLTKPLRLSGAPIANLVASTSGTDSDWVVKVIDVYPDTMPNQPQMGGYELPISLDIFRGRYHASFEKPEALEAGKPTTFRFVLPTVNHVFQPGHRVMVQVQSTLFPLYDRNPQTFVPNIFDAKPSDYQKATQKVWHAPGVASFVELPVVE